MDGLRRFPLGEMQTLIGWTSAGLCHVNPRLGDSSRRVKAGIHLMAIARRGMFQENIASSVDYVQTCHVEINLRARLSFEKFIVLS
jgi:hypothetical protein